jgi:hypothetical protein
VIESVLPIGKGFGFIHCRKALLALEHIKPSEVGGYKESGRCFCLLQNVVRLSRGSSIVRFSLSPRTCIGAIEQNTLHGSMLQCLDRSVAEEG